MGQVTGDLGAAGRELLAAGRQALRHPFAWLVLLLVWTALNAGLGLIPLLGGLALTLLSPLLWGGVLRQVPDYLAGEPPTPAHLFAAFRETDLRSRLLGVGGLTLAFHLLLLALSLLFGVLTVPMLPPPEGGPHLLGVSLFELVLLIAMAPLFLLGAAFYLAVFLGLPLVVFEGSNAVPAVRGGGRMALRHLAYLIPVPLVTAAGAFAEWWVLLPLAVLTVPLLLLFQYRAFRILQPQPDHPDPDPQA